jgi:hypothetical protein
MSDTTSPWKNTPLNKATKEYMDFFRIRAIPASSDDVEYTIAPQYNQRPDLLAHDIYDNARLWSLIVLWSNGIFNIITTCRYGSNSKEVHILFSSFVERCILPRTSCV